MRCFGSVAFKSTGKIYVSLAHDAEDIRLATSAFADAAQELRAERSRG